MKVFTSTELRTKSTEVYNAVMTDDLVGIAHRDRPNMMLMTEEKFRSAMRKAASGRRLRIAQATT